MSGALHKNRLEARRVLAFGEAQEWLFASDYNLEQVNHEQNSKPLGDESEVILAAAGGDTLDQSSIFFGNKSAIGVVGLFLRQAQYRASGQKNELQSFVVRRKWQETSLSLGLGRYASDIQVPELSIFARYEWFGGESQALF